MLELPLRRAGTGRVSRRDLPRPVVLVGAARSGTKVLRDALAIACGIGKVPYDIGYIWQYGSPRSSDDFLDPRGISDRRRSFIRNFIFRYAKGDPPLVIEKTVGNTLRIPAVASIFPDAVYIHLLRDGVDVIESARRQWTAPTDLRYLLAKLRHFPIRAMPVYGSAYLRSIAGRRKRADQRVGTWGPRYRGIDEDLRCCDLLTVCARQWRIAVQTARHELARLAVPVAEVQYEHLVADPIRELTRLAAFIGLAPPPDDMGSGASLVTSGRSGSGRRILTPLELRAVDLEAGDLLGELGYERPRVAAPSNWHRRSRVR